MMDSPESLIFSQKGINRVVTPGALAPGEACGVRAQAIREREVLTDP
jgi:hypothetical protein